MRILAIIGASISAIVGLSAFFSSETFLTTMIDEINRKKPEEEQISHFFFGPDKFQQIFREYRRLYPDGKLSASYWYAVAISAAGVFGTFGFILLLGA